MIPTKPVEYVTSASLVACATALVIGLFTGCPRRPPEAPPPGPPDVPSGPPPDKPSTSTIPPPYTFFVVVDGLQHKVTAVDFRWTEATPPDRTCVTFLESQPPGVYFCGQEIGVGHQGDADLGGSSVGAKRKR